MKQTSRTSSSPGFWCCSIGKKTSLDGGFSSKPCLSTGATLAEREKSVYVVKVQWDKETLQKRGWPCVWRMCDVFFVALYGVWLLFGQCSLFSTWWRLVASLSNILCCIVQRLDIDEFQNSSRSYLPWTFFHAKLRVNHHRCGVYPPLDISFPRVSWVFHIFLYVYPRITRVSPWVFQDVER